MSGKRHLLVFQWVGVGLRSNETPKILKYQVVALDKMEVAHQMADVFAGAVKFTCYHHKTLIFFQKSAGRG